MVRIVLFAFVGCISITAPAQKTELDVRVGTGFFFFSGNTPVSVQDAHDALIRQDPYTVPYGKKSSFSVTAGGAFKYVFKKNLLAGIGLEYQSLSSRSLIDSLHVIGDPVATVTVTAVDGSSALRVNSLCVSPFVGRRLKFKKISLDIIGGLDMSLILSNKEHLKMTGPDSYSFDEERRIHSRKLDIRIRLVAELNVRMFSLYAGYAKGVTNYYPLYIGGQSEAYSHFLQAGIGYRLK